MTATTFSHESSMTQSFGEVAVRAAVGKVGQSLIIFILATSGTFALLQTIVPAISVLAAPVGCILAVILAPRNLRLLLTLVLPVAVLVSVWCSNLYFEIYYDGMSYHQDGMLSIAESFSLLRPTVDGVYSYLTTHYPKLSWFFGAAIAELSGDFNASRSINFVAVIAVFFVGYAVLDVPGKAARLLFSLLIAANPVVFSQLFSNYVDGLLGCFLAIAAYGLYSQFAQTCEELFSLKLVLTGVIGAAALKFTGAVFASVLFLSFLLTWLRIARSLRPHMPLNGSPLWLQLSAAPFQFVALVFIGVAILWHPYITNVLSGKHIFHPAMGAEKIGNLIAGQTRAEFHQLDQWSKLLISVFSQSTDHGPWANSALPPGKIPFTITPGEVKAFAAIDVRSGGWGPLFGGVVLVTAILAILSRWNRSWAIFLGTLALIATINPESWWARFNPQLHLLVCFALVFVFLRSSHRLAAITLSFLLLVNTTLVFLPMHSHLRAMNAAISEALVSTTSEAVDQRMFWRMERFRFEPIFDYLGVNWLPLEKADAKLSCRTVHQEKICFIPKDGV